MFWKDAGVLFMFFVARLGSPLGSLRNGMDTVGGICRIEHMFFGDPFWMKREVLLILFFLSWSRLVCPARQH